MEYTGDVWNSDFEDQKNLLLKGEKMMEQTFLVFFFTHIKLISWPAVYYYVVYYTLYMIKQYCLNSSILIKKNILPSWKNKKIQNH